MWFWAEVGPEDTLGRMARRFRINTASLTAANPELGESGTVVPGQMLRIPKAGDRLHHIQPGDDLESIAESYQITQSALCSANGLHAASGLANQSWIRIPANSEKACIVDPSYNYGFLELEEDIQSLCAKYPFLRLGSAGASFLGRELHVLELGTGQRKVHVNAAFHANEWITSLLLMGFMETAAEAVAQDTSLLGFNMRRLLEETTLVAVPMVNPDGVELAIQGLRKNHPLFEELLEWNGGSTDFTQWKANARGVDLNDQFPAHWEVEAARREAIGPSPRNYGGDAPLTEPEAIAMAELTRSGRFDLVVALHTQGQEIYYNYRGMEPLNSIDIAKRMEAVSGYKPVYLEGSDAGYKDWFIQEFRRPGFTVEAGLGVNPLPLWQCPEMQKQINGIIMCALAER
ncbi:M14 family zinc carboxypeptidase [Paenibacillus turpanensis]|uniref:M14 family zinc carboxypeptidase n=1 Tax=Paenibacillus turpanensis TaxID=2689078 RepID=UPI00140DEF98|nr:M14 family zinc carboxypeptidase [Paenibacillus turpanensis]